MAKLTTGEAISDLQVQLTTLRTEFFALQREYQNCEIQSLRERLVALEVEVRDLKSSKQESEKRHWQFIYIFLGALATLLVTVVVQLVIAWAKK